MSRAREHLEFLEGSWEDICSSLACENLHEDGELSMAQAEQKRRDLISRAKKLYDAGCPCPQNIFEWCEDEEAIEPFLEETNHEDV